MSKNQVSPDRLRLCFVNGEPVANSSDQYDASQPKLRRVSQFQQFFQTSCLITQFVEKHGRLPDPEQAETISKVVNHRIRASDGKLYPKLSEFEKKNATKMKNERKEYHRVANQVSRLTLALEYVGTAAEPADMATHVKDNAQLGIKVEIAIEWLKRFAAELRDRGEPCYQ